MWLSMVDASVVVEGNEIAKTQVIGISIRVVGDSFLHTAITSKSMDTNLQGQQVMAACLQFLIHTGFLPGSSGSRTQARFPEGSCLRVLYALRFLL